LSRSILIWETKQANTHPHSWKKNRGKLISFVKEEEIELHIPKTEKEINGGKHPKYQVLKDANEKRGKWKCPRPILSFG
jgi:hypothetical protein